MKHRPTSRRRRTTKSVLRFLDLERAKASVLNSLTSLDARSADIDTPMTSACILVTQTKIITPSIGRARFTALVQRDVTPYGSEARCGADRTSDLL